MTNEEFDKRMDFIVEQQAQFASDMQQLREAQAQTEHVVTQTVEIVGRLANGTLEGFKDVNTKIEVLVDSQIRTDEKINALADDLRNLIAVVDRYFSEGRNGNDS
jgi:ABC-type transporter Mla subunit MlaD